MYMSLFLFLTFLLYCSFFTIIIVYYNITVLWLLWWRTLPVCGTNKGNSDLIWWWCHLVHTPLCQGSCIGHKQSFTVRLTVLWTLFSGAQWPYIIQLHTKFKFELDAYYAGPGSVDSCKSYQKRSVFTSLFSVLPMWRFLIVTFSQSVVFAELCCPLYLYITAVHRVLRCEDIRRCAVRQVLC